MDEMQAKLLSLMEAQFYYLQDPVQTSLVMKEHSVNLPTVPFSFLGTDQATRIKAANAVLRSKLRGKP